MATQEYKRFIDGIAICPKSISTNANLGDLEVLFDNKLHFYGASNDAVVQETVNATLTNKSMSGGANTFTNIPTTALSNIANNTALANISGISASPVAVSLTSASTASTLVFRNSSGKSNFKGINLDGSTSGTISITPTAIVTNYPIVLPAAQGAANTVPLNDGAGNLSWFQTDVAPSSSTLVTRDSSARGNFTGINLRSNGQDLLLQAQGGLSAYTIQFPNNSPNTELKTFISDANGSLVWNYTNMWCDPSTVGGTADAIIINPVVQVLGYQQGQSFTFVATGNNITTTPTINISALGPKTIVASSGGNLIPSDIITNGIITVVYDGNNFELQQVIGKIVFKAGLTIAQSIPTTVATTVIFNTVIFNSGGGSYNTATGEYAVPSSGYYYVGGMVAFASNASGIREIDGTNTTTVDSAALQYRDPSIVGNSTILNGGRIIFANTGDILVIRAFQNGAAFLNVGSPNLVQYNYMDIYKIK